MHSVVYKSMFRIFALLLALTSMVRSDVAAQSSDCNTAIPVCSSFYSQNNSPSGTGNIFEQAPGTCQTGGEFNSAWYVFTVQQAGFINFTLTPNNLNDDYDWSLFNITNAGCAGINNGSSPEVSCNSYGQNFGPQGTTGISTSQGGSGNSNGPGNINGPPFNANLNVQVGQVYALVVMNYSATLNGYSLDFGASTASIFDQNPPQIVSVTQNCEASQLVINFSESVLTNTLGTIPLNINIGGQTFIPSSITSSGNAFSDEVVMNFSSSLPAGSGIIGLNNNGIIQDFCGNLLTESFNTPISAPLVIVEAVSTPACFGEGGNISVNSVTGGTEPYSFLINNVEQAGAVFDNLNPGSYQISVSDAQGCFAAQAVAVNDLNPQLELGQDIQLCDLQTSLSASVGTGVFAWSPSPGVTFSSSSSPQTNVSTGQPGDYIIRATLNLNGCIAEDSLNVEFNLPPQVNIETTGTSCFDACDGKVTIESINGESLLATIGGNSLNGSSIQFTGICGGSYVAQIAFSAQCQAGYTITVTEPSQVVANFAADNYVVPVDAPVVNLVNQSVNADSVLWELVNYEDLFSSVADSWTLELPAVAGVYEVKLTAFGHEVCTDEVTARIIVKDNFYVFIPNAFTPNRDGINDVFYPQFSVIPDRYEFLIFDRWGSIIFRSQDPAHPWTGEVNDGEYFAGNGIYQWRLTVSTGQVEKETYTGIVSLIR